MREFEKAVGAAWPVTLPAGDAVSNCAAFLSTRRLLVFVMLAAIFTLTARPITDPDFWWHLRTGQLIYETRAIPHADIYSYTAQGKEWVTHEWLAEILIYAIYKLSGWGGLVVSFSCLMTAALWIAYRRAAALAPHPYVAGGVTLLGTLATAPVWGVRPQMISFLFTSIYLSVLGDYARRRAPSKSLWWLVPLMSVWANMHGGYAMGLGVIGVTGVGLALEELLREKSERQLSARLRPLLGVFAACVLVVPLNPNGLRMFSYPFETLASQAMHAYIEEWFTPDFHLIISQPFALLLFATFVALALSPQKARPVELLLLCVSGYAALRAWRNIPFFALVAVPLLAEHLWHLLAKRAWWNWLRAPEKREAGTKAFMQLTLNVLLLICVPVGLGVANVAKVVAGQRAVEEEKYPAAAVEFLRARPESGAIYNDYGWGGYLIWKLHPQREVYIDGRADVYGDAFMEETVKTLAGERGWREPLERYGVRTVLIKPDTPLASLLRQEATWQLAYEDRQSVVFFKQ